MLSKSFETARGHAEGVSPLFVSRAETREKTAPVKPRVEFLVAPEFVPPYRVLVHNDDVTPMDFVTAVLEHVFELPFERAEAVMLTAHYTGVAYVASYARPEAEARVNRAHTLARREGFPLTFSLEPEE